MLNIPEEIKRFIGNKNIIINIFKIQVYDSVVCSGFIDFVFVQKFKETGDSRFIYRNELDKACFQHDEVYRAFKDLPRRTASDKVLRDNAFDIASNVTYEGY